MADWNARVANPEFSLNRQTAVASHLFATRIIPKTPAKAHQNHQSMNKQEVLDAMASAGLERPRVMLVQDNGLFFELFAGPNDPDKRKPKRISVTGTRNCKAAKNDVANAIESLKG